MIYAKNASLTYNDGTMALKAFDLQVEKGEILYISGSSGSGKTSLLKLFLGSHYPTTGEIRVLGESIKPQNKAGIRKMRQEIGPVFQEFRLLDGRTVYENVLLGIRFLKINRHEMKELAFNSIQRVGLEHKLHHTIDRLSWGECQRVAIARAVARKPKLIIADEPTGNLDDVNAAHILELLTSFKSDNTSVIITTHATHLLKDYTQGLFMKMDSGVFELKRRG